MAKNSCKFERNQPSELSKNFIFQKNIVVFQYIINSLNDNLEEC